MKKTLAKFPIEIINYINEQLERELELRSEFEDHNSYAFGHSSGCSEAYNNVINFIKDQQQ